MSYKFLVINACEKRKQKMIELFKQLDISDNLIYYLQASTPENSEEYFIDAPVMGYNTKKLICCGRSHYRALEYAARDESPDYTIILEDDAAFHKRYFLKVIEEIISNWEQHFNHCHYVSLGWLPGNNYNHYKLKKNMKVKSISNIDNNICFLNDFYNFGAQCYMVKKNKIQHIALLMNQKTFNSYRENLIFFMKKIHGENFNSYSTTELDHTLNKMMSYEIILPPLVIEQKNTVSSLEHDNDQYFWSRFFDGYEEEMKNYMTY